MKPIEFDEKEEARKLFSLDKKAIVACNNLLKNKSLTDILNLATIHLLYNENVNPLNVNDYLIKWHVLACYSFIKLKIKSVKILEFEEIIGDVSLEKMKNIENNYKIVDESNYNDQTFSYALVNIYNNVDINNSLKIYKHQIEINNDIKSKAVCSDIFNSMINFFTMSNDPIYILKNLTKYDLLICEALNNKPRHFIFEIIKDDKNDNDYDKEDVLFIGMFFDSLIEEREMNNANYFKLIFRNKEFKYPSFYEENSLTINLKFKYNNSMYLYQNGHLNEQ